MPCRQIVVKLIVNSSPVGAIPFLCILEDESHRIWCLLHCDDNKQQSPDWPFFLIYSVLTSRYTSLGSMENTHPNPGLQVVDSKGIISYKPAYMLANGDSERAGRN